MDNPPIAAPTASFKDRREGLIAFGVLVILLGGLCALLVPLMLVGQVLSAKATGGTPNLRMVLPSLLTHGLLAVTLVWLGVGSILCRRWARALMLILGWSWLGVGVVSVSLTALVLPRMMAELPTPGARLVVQGITLIFLIIFFVVIPAVLVGFYQSRHVRATVEARDPVPRWTDRCPLPVLGVSLWLWVGAGMMLTMPWAYNAVLPWFGTLLSGLAGTLAYLGLATLWGALAWGWWRLRPWAWWGLLAALVIFASSNALTFVRLDLNALYQAMGYPPEQLPLLEQHRWLTGQTMLWLSFATLLPLLGYLVWVKRFLGQPADR